MNISVLLTTYNRKEKTLACLRNLFAQQLPGDAKLTVFLTDDASADGTAQAVKASFPQVNVYHGSGSFFWAGGMRHTWQQALASNADFYLLLNDDTMLNSNAVEVLLHTAASDDKAICVGSTSDPATGKISYGGRKLNNKSKWDGGHLVSSGTESLECDVANANILLVPKAIVASIGILSAGFTHGLADYDYTIKARKAGFKLLVAPGFLGSCTDDHGNNWKSAKTTLKERIAYMKSPKGLAYSEYLKLIREHFPLSYPSAFAKLWMKTFFPFIWDTFKK